MRALIRQLRPAVLTVVVFTLIFGVGYPLLSTAIGQVAFGDKADGSLIERDGVVVGSELIGQSVLGPEVLRARGRPRRATATTVRPARARTSARPAPICWPRSSERAAAYREANGLAADALVPVDAVTASGSGLDPHISVANARLQAPRVAEVRGLDLGRCWTWSTTYTDGRDLRVLGEPGVNVVRLNLALDDLAS